LVSVGSEQSFSSVEEFGSSGSQMDSRELQEICQDLRGHEEHVHCNRSSIFNLVSRFHELKNQISTQVAKIMGSLMDLKKQIAVVEAECSLLQNLALNLCKGDQSIASSQKMAV
jgi:hypothetical protein